MVIYNNALFTLASTSYGDLYRWGEILLNIRTFNCEQRISKCRLPTGLLMLQLGCFLVSKSLPLPLALPKVGYRMIFSFQNEKMVSY